MAKLLQVTGKYGVVELNHVASVKTGEIEAQYEMEMATVEQGSLVKLDHIAKKVKFGTATDEVYLVASEEKLYDARQGREDFVNVQSGFGVRCYKLSKGDKFETNTCELGALAYATLASDIKAGTTVYGYASATGHIEVTKTANANAKVELQAIEAVLLPNGRQGFKFLVTKGL